MAPAADLFRAVAADQRVTGEGAAVAEVARLCDGLPVALRAAADILSRRPVWTVRQLANRLAGLGVAGLPPVAELIASAVRPLPEQVRRVLVTLAALPGDGEVTAVAVAAGCGPAQARAALEDLLDRHLVVQPRSGRYRLHSLVRHTVLADRVARSAS